MSLKELQIGKSARVLAVGGESTLRRRLLDMGITPNTILKLIKTAPMGDPIEIKLRGYILTLRNDEAEHIAVEVVTA